MEPRTVLLVRHGQASFGKSDYDRLSQLGHRQARLLGEDLGRRGWTPDRIVCGSLKRHQETVAEIAVGAGWDLEPETDADWNELDHDAIISAYKPAYRHLLVLKADMVRTLRPRAAFEEMFEQAILRWVSGEYDQEYAESFPAFRSRVDAALDRALEQPYSRQLVVSSVGCISRVASRVLAGGDMNVWKQFAFSGVNTGVTRVVLDRRGPQLLTYNEIGHLDALDLASQR
ncbi:histidine phosphatase family protein [Luteipulveratus sp. YIM 133132]|uniref:Histidine phosphatase family protein n=1 Tax=Luteipulveratus flavus TaxID=3031728 RepID=A0ABT6CAQ7_9MICO|nr:MULTISPECIES: histidine phosphatase family protein [unclassified Luteipulveratus]MDE9364821.1 histidine phosphatase family protein [Luteipulveratus sp. YIM 133132]MDF8265966.1 histidine phosphatase family protein [Luteipulveratus sp. YIM 133296]